MSRTAEAQQVGQLSALPEPGIWQIDVAHSTVGFQVRHLMVGRVRGRFSSLDGEIRIAERQEESSVSVTIDAASIDTSQPQRDEHLRSADFLDVEHFPTLRFESTLVDLTSPTTGRLHGGLTIRGVTRPVVLDVEYLGQVTDPWGATKIAFEASTRIDREEFGLTWNQALETGGVLVGKDVKIELEVQAAKAEAK